MLSEGVDEYIEVVFRRVSEKESIHLVLILLIVSKKSLERFSYE